MSDGDTIVVLLFVSLRVNATLDAVQVPSHIKSDNCNKQIIFIFCAYSCVVTPCCNCRRTGGMAQGVIRDASCGCKRRLYGRLRRIRELRGMPLSNIDVSRALQAQYCD